MSNNQDHAVNKGTALARLGAVCYVLWGLLHYHATYDLFQLAATVPASMVRGRLQQDAFYTAGLATISIIVGLWLNWRNDRFGFWLNAVAIGLGDIPFILFVLLPGYMPFWPGVLGPALWIAGLILTALGQALESAAEPETGSSRRTGAAI
jgi:hypothetical protein